MPNVSSETEKQGLCLQHCLDRGNFIGMPPESFVQLQKCDHPIEVSIHSLDYPKKVMDKRDKYSPLMPRLHEGGVLNVWGMVTSDCDQAWLATSVNGPDNPSQSQLVGQSVEMLAHLWP